MSKINVIALECDVKIAFHNSNLDIWIQEAGFASIRNARNYAENASREGFDRVVIDDGKVMYYFRNGDRVASMEEN